MLCITPATHTSQQDCGRRCVIAASAGAYTLTHPWDGHKNANTFSGCILLCICYGVLLKRLYDYCSHTCACISPSYVVPESMHARVSSPSMVLQHVRNCTQFCMPHQSMWHTFSPIAVCVNDAHSMHIFTINITHISVAIIPEFQYSHFTRAREHKSHNRTCEKCAVCSRYNAPRERTHILWHIFPDLICACLYRRENASAAVADARAALKVSVCVC